jgi:hypothetical protein
MSSCKKEVCTAATFYKGSWAIFAQYRTLGTDAYGRLYAYLSSDLGAAPEKWRRETVIGRMPDLDPKRSCWSWIAATFQDCAIAVSLRAGYYVMSSDPKSPEWTVRQVEGYEFMQLESVCDECLFALMKKSDGNSFSLELWYTRSMGAEWKREVIAAEWTISQYPPNIVAANGILAVQFYHNSKPYFQHKPITDFP